TVDLRLALLASAFENVQFPRYAIAIKPLFFALAGVGALVVEGGVRTIGGRPPRGGAVESLSAAGYDEGEQALADALARERDALPADVPLRVAFLRVSMGGGTY